jgi:L-asparaginase II
MPGVAAAKVYRGDAVEAEHTAVVAVVDSEGRLTHYLGDPDSVYMTRSSIKPFQVLPLILSGGFDQFKFTERQLAVMCGSHCGTDEHREVISSILQQAGNRPEDLKCGAHVPLFMMLDNLFPKFDEHRDPLRHNCSGKHAGFLALTRHLGDPDDTYINPEFQAQRQVRQAVARICEQPVDELRVSIDGCSAPNYDLPIRKMAVGFKNLAIPQAKDAGVRDALKRVKSAMTTHPFMVAGEKRFDYDFMRSFPGNGVSKIGAEAIQGLGFAHPPVGICVKIPDGGRRVLGSVCVHVLRKIGIIRNIDDYPLLKGYWSPEVRNYRNLITGRIVVDFDLKKA